MQAFKENLLFVTVPPERLIILDDKGTNIPHHILGPYNEGSSVNITCIATGGKSSQTYPCPVP